MQAKPNTLMNSLIMACAWSLFLNFCLSILILDCLPHRNHLQCVSGCLIKWMVRSGWSKVKSAIFLLGCSATCVYRVGGALSACCRQGVRILVPDHYSHFCLPANELCTLVVGFGRPFSLYIVYSRWQRLMIYPQFCRNVFICWCILD